MSRARRVAENVAPPLIGACFGTALFRYSSEYRSAPPEFVASNGTLLSLHNGALSLQDSVRSGLEKLERAVRGGGDAADADGGAQREVEDPHPILAQARRAADDNDLQTCAQILQALFLHPDTPEYLRILTYEEKEDPFSMAPAEEEVSTQKKAHAALEIFKGESPLGWLTTIVPALHKKGVVGDLPAVVMCNWLVQIDPEEMVRKNRGLSVDLPLRLLRESLAKEEGADEQAQLCTMLLSRASSYESREMRFKRWKKLDGGFWSWFSGTPRNSVADMLAKDEAVVKRIVSLLAAASGPHPAVLILHMIDSDAKNVPVLARSGVVETAVGELVDKFGSFTMDGAVKPDLGGTPDVYCGATLLQLLSMIAGEAHDGVKKQHDVRHLRSVQSPEAVKAVADAVFRSVAMCVDDRLAVVSGVHLLSCLRGCDDGASGVPVESAVDNLWLIEKGIVLAAAQWISHHGHDAHTMDLVTSFITPILNDAEHKDAIPDEHSHLFGQVYPPLPNAPFSSTVTHLSHTPTPSLSTQELYRVLYQDIEEPNTSDADAQLVEGHAEQSKDDASQEAPPAASTDASKA